MIEIHLHFVIYIITYSYYLQHRFNSITKSLANRKLSSQHTTAADANFGQMYWMNVVPVDEDEFRFGNGYTFEAETEEGTYPFGPGFPMNSEGVCILSGYDSNKQFFYHLADAACDVDIQFICISN